MKVPTGVQIWVDRPEGLKIGQVPQRLLQALTRDFYRPMNLVELYSSVFPGQHYHPRSSVDSMHQAMRRLRAFLGKAAPAVWIEEMGGRYRLAAREPVEVWVERNLAKPQIPSHLEKALKLISEAQSAEGNAERFTSRKAASLWGLSRNGALVWLRELERFGAVRKEGAGPSVSYVLGRRGAH